MMKRHIHLLLALIALLMGHTLAQAAPTQQASLEQAEALMWENDFIGAEAMVDALIEADPQDGTAYAQRCFLHSLRGRSEAAWADCQQAIDLAPDEAVGYIYLTRVYDWRGEYRNAIKTGEKAIALAPDNGLAHSFLGEAYLDAGQIEAAKDALDVAVELDNEHPEVWRNLAIYHGYFDEVDDQLEAIEKARQLAPNFTRYINYRASIHLNESIHLDKDKKEYEEAMALYEESLAIAEANGDIEWQVSNQLNIGNVHEWQDEDEAALKIYEAALELARNGNSSRAEAAALSRLGRLARSQDKYDEALAYYQQALEIYQTAELRLGEAGAWWNIGWVHELREGYEEALENYKAALDIYESLDREASVANLLRDMGDVHREQKEYEQALKNYKTALKMHQELQRPLSEIAILHRIADVYDDQEDWADALDHNEDAFDIAQKLQSKNTKANAWNQLGLHYWHSDENRKAIDAYETARDLWEEAGSKARKATAWDNIAVAQRAMGNYAQAFTAHEEARSIHRDVDNQWEEAGNLRTQADVYEQLGYYDEAVRHYGQATELYRLMQNKDGEITVALSVGAMWDELGYYSSALETYEQALNLLPKVTDADRKDSHLLTEALIFSNIGETYLEMGRPDDALAFYLRALDAQQTYERVEPERIAHTLSNLGRIYTYQGDSAQAISSYTEAMARYEEAEDEANQVIIMQVIASLHRNQDDYEKALATDQEALALAQTLDEDTWLRHKGVDAALLSIAFDYQGLEQWENAREMAARVEEEYPDSFYTYSAEQLARDPQQTVWPPLFACDNLIWDGQRLLNTSRSWGALQKFEAAKACYERFDHKWGMAVAIDDSGTALWNLGEYGKAEEREIEAYQLYQEMVFDSLNLEAESEDESQGYEQSQAAIIEWLKQLQRARELTVVKEGIPNDSTTYEQIDQLFTEIARNDLATVKERQEKYDEAEALYREALFISAAIHDDHEKGNVLTNLGAMYEKLGRNEDALDKYLEAWALVQEMTDGTLDLNRNYLDKHDEAQKLSDPPGARPWGSRALEGAMRLSYELGDREQAQALAQAYLIVYTGDADVERARQILRPINCAEAFEAGQEFRRQYAREAALPELDQALVCYQLAEDKAQQSAVLNEIGLVNRQAAFIDAALSSYDRALRTAEEAEDDLGQGIAKTGRVSIDIFILRGGLVTGAALREQIDDAVASLKDAADVSAYSRALGVQAEVYALQGRLTQAEKSADKAVSVAEEADSPQDLAYALVSQGSVYMIQGRLIEAEAVLDQALQHFIDVGDLYGEAGTQTVLGMVYATQLRQKTADQAFERAIEIYKEAGAPLQEGVILLNRAGIAFEREAYEEAIAWAEEAERIINEADDVSSDSVLPASGAGLEAWAILTQIESHSELEQIKEACKLSKNFTSLYGATNPYPEINQLIDELDCSGDETASDEA